MRKKEVLQYFLEPWYLASKEEAETYLRSVGIDPEESKKEFMEFIRSYNAGIELKVKPEEPTASLHEYKA